MPRQRVYAQYAGSHSGASSPHPSSAVRAQQDVNVIASEAQRDAASARHRSTQSGLEPAPQRALRSQTVSHAASIDAGGALLRGTSALAEGGGSADGALLASAEGSGAIFPPHAAKETRRSDRRRTVHPWPERATSVGTEA
jgi:hypothetical protein